MLNARNAEEDCIFFCFGIVCRTGAMNFKTNNRTLYNNHHIEKLANDNEGYIIDCNVLPSLALLCLFDPVSKPSKPNRTKNIVHMHLDLLAFLPVATVPVLLLTILVAVTVGHTAAAVLASFSRQSTATTTA